MADTLWMRLREINWEQQESSPQFKKSLPKTIESLASRKESRAIKAGHSLWTALCSGKVYPATEACLPFITEVLPISTPAVQCEILDILTKVKNDLGNIERDDLINWQSNTLKTLEMDKALISHLTRSSDEIVADKAENLLSSL